MNTKSPLHYLLLLFALGISGLLAGATDLQAQANAAFTASDVYPCQGATVSFTNLTTGSPTAFTWLENGLFFSNANNPTRTYNTPGTYLISLIASSAGGPDTASTLIVVNPGVGVSAAGLDASCFGFSDGAIDLSPTPGTPNVSVCFDGTDDFIAADGVAGYSYSNGMTIEAWVKPEASWLSGDGMVMSSNTTGGGNNFLFSYNTSLQKFIWFDDAVGNRLQNGISPRGQWHHVAVTITATNLVTMYVNGVQVLPSFATGPNWRPVNDLFSIGQEWDGAATSQHFNGCIDEVRVWTAPLNTATVVSNYNNSCGSISPTHPNIASLVAYFSMNEGTGNFVFDRSGNQNHGSYNGNTWGNSPATDFGCFSEGTGYAYTWSNGATTEDLSGITAGTYMVTVTDGAGCTGVTAQSISEPPQIVYSLATTPNDTLCLGDTVDITATGSYTYSYSPSASLSAASGSSVSAFPNATTTYEVIAEDGFGCRDTSNLTLTVNPLPVPVITGDDTICQGDTASLTASGGVNYQWSTGANQADIDVTPQSDSLFGVLVTDANGCQAATGLQVTVFQRPTAAIAGDDTICFGDPASLTASGGALYFWSTGDASAAITVNPGNDSTFSVLVIDGNGCQDTADQLVVVNPLPVVAIAGDDTLCAGDTTTLTASGGTAYLWTSGDPTAAITVSPAATTTYGVLVTDANSCQNGDTVRVVVNALPVPSITGDDDICVGDTTVLTAAGGNSYNWNTGDTTSTISVQPAANFTYQVVVTDGNGCSQVDSLPVTVNALPSIAFTGDTAICVGDTAQLSASGGNSYAWSTGDTTAGIAVDPAVSTVYTVIATNGNNCSSTDSVSLTVNALPLVTINGDAVVCEGDTASLLASGGTDYLWSTGDTTAGVGVAPASATTYSVAATDSNGCTDQAVFSVAVNALPTVVIAGQGTICEGDTALLLASGADDLLWSTGDTTTSIDVAPNASTTYLVTGTDSNGCAATDSFPLVVNALPAVAIIAQDSICDGDSILLTGSGANSYLWNTGSVAGDITVSPQADSTFVLTGTDANGCTNTDSHTVVVNPNPVSPPITQVGNQLTTAIGYSAYQWYLNGNPIPGANNSFYVYDSSGTYTVEVTNSSGCSGFSNPIDFTVSTPDPSGHFAFDVYPNPNQGQFTLRIESQKSYDLDLRLVDLLGQVVFTRQLRSQAGTWTVDLAPEDLAQGVYLLEVRSGDLRATRRMVVD